MKKLFIILILLLIRTNIVVAEAPTFVWDNQTQNSTIQTNQTFVWNTPVPTLAITPISESTISYDISGFKTIIIFILEGIIIIILFIEYILRIKAK
jgi:hypothetical protein